MGKKKSLTPADVELQREAERGNYRLRSAFFYRKLKEYNTLSFPAMIAQMLPMESLYDWQDRAQWGIGEDAYEFIQHHADLHVLQVFCHPKLLREQPHLLAYYRNIAALPRKGVSHLVGIDTEPVEIDTDNRILLTDEQALKLALLFNEHITLIIEASIRSLTGADLYGILLTSTGAGIDGSWRNAIGGEAEKVIQRLLIDEAKDRGILGALIPRRGTAVELYEPELLSEQLGRIHEYRGILLTNRTTILFSSEPDVSFIDKGGRTRCVLEVKGGADTAGALERYGAAKKTFAEVRRRDGSVVTVLVANCITPEVEERMKTDSDITSYYHLTAILKAESEPKRKFMDLVFSSLACAE